MTTVNQSGVFLKTELVESEIRRLDRAIQTHEELPQDGSGLANLAALRMCRASLKAELESRAPRRRTHGGSLRIA